MDKLKVSLCVDYGIIRCNAFEKKRIGTQHSNIKYCNSYIQPFALFQLHKRISYYLYVGLDHENMIPCGI